LNDIEVNHYWNNGNEKELKIHRIHAYPAKFPSFIANKALDYVSENFNRPGLVADIFCGCGTVALEAKRKNIDFWGCDINPVATLIARTKSNCYNIKRLMEYFNKILLAFNKLNGFQVDYEQANERIKYWYEKESYIDLAKLKKAIDEVVPRKSKYYLFFMCAFSNILKPTSRWLTKSIKPQIDPRKKPANVIKAFCDQFMFMKAAFEEVVFLGESSSTIVTENFLSKKLKKPKVDLIITSPPYVTSYEYADLHQLSSLWLGYTDDYRKLRKGSIGSSHHAFDFKEIERKLNKTASCIVSRLHEKDISQARAVAKYFFDIQLSIKECETMLNNNGFLVVVIGDTEYKGVRIENSRHISESLLENGFAEVYLFKRKISRKNLTPYRDEFGRFTNDCGKRKVYHEEYIIIGRKI
jgi:methylase of polypeptide subunit release factors